MSEEQEKEDDSTITTKKLKEIEPLIIKKG
jgi:hypothetical protein